MCVDGRSRSFVSSYVLLCGVYKLNCLKDQCGSFMSEVWRSKARYLGELNTFDESLEHVGTKSRIWRSKERRVWKGAESF